ncbi:hypothetical protein IFM89_028922 [Coptis chinensis]|uniref:Pentatricopeptide repeat-containing protein n=1 Tax=Coptis chinensis TaxID=261450 RepID=A0A835LGV8_9MAGN|nr:hypothetical protein IFM89_028922 [Coptis chinensis]
MYTCCGVTDVAKRFFDKMGEKDAVTWNIMITHFSKQDDDMELARKLFDEMPKKSVRGTLNEVTVVAVLVTCADLGALDLEIARDVFYEMKGRTVVSWSAMIGGYAMHVQAEEALKFFFKMSRIGGCKVHKNVELAEEAIKHLLVLEPLNDGYYVVLSNVYADAGRWEDAARVRMLMSMRGMQWRSAWGTLLLMEL